MGIIYPYSFYLYFEDIMFDKLIKRILSLFPEKLSNLYYKYEPALLYIFFGAFTTLVSVTVQYISSLSGANTAAATTVSWVCAVTFAFFTNKLFVFRSKSEGLSDWFRQAGQFYGARLVSYLLELGFMLLTVDILHFNMMFMKIMAQVFILLINYLFSKLVIFRKKNENTLNSGINDEEQ